MTEACDLRRGDDDAERKWGGTIRSSSAPATIGDNQNAAVADVAPVRDMQRDLRRVGILLGPEPNGTFDLPTEWSVREFQIYAKMERVAKEDTASTATEYVDRLSAVPTGTARYAGPVSGVYNAATRAAMAHWLAQSWRCPVVLDAWKAPKKGAPEERVARNVWNGRDESFSGGIVKARDFTDYYRKQGAAEVWPIGRASPSGYGFGPSGTTGTAEKPCEVLPESLVGTTWSRLDPAGRSTFKVSRAVAEVECLAFFDVVNAFDAAIESMGIFHFAMLQAGDGELAGLLNRLASDHRADYDRCMAFFGADVVPGAGVRSPRFKLTDEAGAGVEPDLSGPEPERNRKLKAYNRELQYFRNWHWFYRFVMLGRTTVALWRLEWRFALDRLALIRSMPLDATLVSPTSPDATPPVRATIGDVFTSELAIGYILRWHVNRPNDICTSKKNVPAAGDNVVEIIEKAKNDAPRLAWSKPCTSWGQDEEDALIKAIETVPKPKAREVEGSLPRIESFPNVDGNWSLDRGLVGKLDRGRNSFKLASAPAPLPPAPAPPGPVPPPPASPERPGTRHSPASPPDAPTAPTR